MKKYLLGAAALLLTCLPAHADDLADAVDQDYEYIFNLYKHFHENPELSFKESESAKRMAAELEPLGFDVTTGFGDKWAKEKAKRDAGQVYEGVGGYGLVAVMKNGEGPTVMLRADMDALPLEEKTGLPFASKVVSQDYLGQTVPVMHACAHDSHMAILIGAARRLAEMKDQWSGTLVLIGQPAEELGLGALAMLEAGLYDKFPKPDYVLATHTSGWDPAGDIAYTPGWALANVDSVDIFVKGIGAHGSAPQMGKDPIVISSQIVNALQTLVSRELDPLDSGVVTVGAFQAGYKHNIIPDEAHLQITVRSYEDNVRAKLLEGIERIAIAQAKSAGLPDDLMPVVRFEDEYTPSTFNNEELTSRVMGAVAAELGPERVYERAPSMGGEDFGQFTRTAENIPTLIFWTGGNDPKAMKAAREGKGPLPPANHSPYFAPIPEPTLKTGVHAMTIGALELLQKN
ncbi:amidohydrolase [Hyphococcus sp. DH-69]|uniref:amidohydrolase n=1 Tax=Hyphococcus formosus TaxID=3143534 RepID=UPI00398A837C